MFRSKLQLAKVLQEKLLEFPEIVNAFNSKELHVLVKYTNWLIQIEDILSTHRIMEVSEIAGYRSKLVAAKYSIEKNSNIKKFQLKVATESLYDIQKIILEIYKPLEIQINECRELIRQLLNILSQTKAIKYKRRQTLQNFVLVIWNFIQSNDQLNPGAVKLKTILNVSDIQLLMAEEIKLEDF